MYHWCWVDTGSGNGLWLRIIKQQYISEHFFFFFFLSILESTGLQSETGKKSADLMKILIVVVWLSDKNSCGEPLYGESNVKEN